MSNGSSECADAEYCGGAHCQSQCPEGSECGPDGCGASCGVGCGRGSACRDFHCIPASYPYSCQNPVPLLSQGQALLGEHRLIFDLSQLTTADEVAPACTSYRGSDDLILSFTVPPSFARGVGVDAWLRGQLNEDVDTVLEIRQGRCRDLPSPPGNGSGGTTTPALVEQGDDFVCSDNSEPPGVCIQSSSPALSSTRL